MEISKDNIRIAKNTLFLYFRMLLIMGVSLFTVRVVLRTLGAEDYGINNVVGGIVAMLGFFTSTMTSATQRFFAYELGKNNIEKLGRYFKLTFLLYIGFGLIVLLLAETVGLWFVKTQLLIPDERTHAALWVYHFSIASFILHMFVIPYNSMIIAYEQMHIYAYVSVIEAILKLIIVYVLVIFEADKLIIYAVLSFSVTMLMFVFYMLYGIFKYKACKPGLYWNREMFVELTGYSGWSLFGALSGMVKNQGINILLNVFFNPIVNAARAIAFQVNSAVNLFVTNFYQAVRPQIIKQYAANEQKEMMKLVFRSSKFCYYLILFLAIPLLIETPYILSLWLTNVPDHTILFTRLVIITSMIESISYPFMTAVSATGKIKWYQIVTGSLLILNLPIAYFFLKLGYPPETTMYVILCVALISQISRMLFMKKIHQMSIQYYMKHIISILIVVTILSLGIPFSLNRIFSDEGGLRLIIVVFSSFISTIISIYFIGLTQKERNIFNKLLLSLKHKLIKPKFDKL